MRRRKKTTSHNYITALAAYMAARPQLKGGIIDVKTYHDDYCNLVNGKGFCNCEPTFEHTVVKEPRVRIHHGALNDGPEGERQR